MVLGMTNKPSTVLSRPQAMAFKWPFDDPIKRALRSMSPGKWYLAPIVNWPIRSSAFDKPLQHFWTSFPSRPRSFAENNSMQTPFSGTAEDESVHASQRCLLLQLPDEILLQIVRYIIPSGLTFYAFPARMRNNRLGTVVYASGTLQSTSTFPIESLLRPNDTAIASSCARLQNILYTVLYGENHYIFAMSTRAISPSFHWNDIDAKYDVSSIVSIFRGLNSDPNPLCPLTPRSSMYLKELTIHISSSTHADTSEQQALKDKIRTAMSQFTPGHNVKKLDIDVRRPNNDSSHIFSLGWHIRPIYDFINRPKDSVLFDQNSKESQAFLELFGDLRNVEHLVLSANPGPDALTKIVKEPELRRRRKRRRRY